MRRFIFRFLFFVAAFLPLSAHAQEEQLVQTQKDSVGMTKFDRRVNHLRRYWASLIPTQFVLQNAGNMGLISTGIGWAYGKRGQWETQILWGYIPKYNSTNAHLTNTIKENYIPWSISFNDWLALEPLEASLYLNTVYGHEFWKSQPGRYPDKYYEALSTKFRINVALGQRLTFNLNPEKYHCRSIALFYEVSSCDLYIRSLFQGTDISFWDILGLSVGVKFVVL